MKVKWWQKSPTQKFFNGQSWHQCSIK